MPSNEPLLTSLPLVTSTPNIWVHAAESDRSDEVADTMELFLGIS